MLRLQRALRAFARQPIAIALLYGLCQAAAAQTIEPQEVGFDMISDLGGVGLMQTPTARHLPDGGITFSSGRVAPYIRNAITFQLLPWLEGVLRYTSEQNLLYGGPNSGLDQSNKDKGADIKVRLLEESATFPQVALGFRDFAGTGHFSSEYLVFSRRYYDFDFTFGIGWGNLGTRGQIPNPFGFLLNSFKHRSNKVGLGGTFSPQYFHGEKASILAGVSYRTPIRGLTVKLELDGNNYQAEGTGINLKADSPFNIGLTYNHNNWLDLSLGFERGNTLMFQVALKGNIHSSTGMPKLDPPPEKLKLREQTNIAIPKEPQQQKDTELRLARSLESHKYRVNGVSISGREATIAVEQGAFRASARAIGRAARIVANEAPPEVEKLTYINMESGLEINRVSLLRKDLENAERGMGSPEEIAINAVFSAPQADEKSIRNNPGRYPSLDWSWSPAMRHHIGGPDAPYFYQIFLRLDGELQLAKGLSLNGGLGFDIKNNFDGLTLPSDSRLPHVRSDIKNYLKEGKNNISHLQLDYLANMGSNWYGRLSGGIFEEMFGGIGGEILYKPFGSPWAIGLELNRVQQRDYDQRFSFRDYKVSTGHLDFYYKLPYYNTLAQISVGRYLAGDKGVTIDLSRHFDNGSVFGVFATKTNVSANDFGEGSFDKGFYISIPIDMLTLYSTRGNIAVGYRPLTRDGGQRLIQSKRLYPIVVNSGPDAMVSEWDQLLN